MAYNPANPPSSWSSPLEIGVEDDEDVQNSDEVLQQLESSFDVSGTAGDDPRDTAPFLNDGDDYDDEKEPSSSSSISKLLFSCYASNVPSSKWMLSLFGRETGHSCLRYTWIILSSSIVIFVFAFLLPKEIQYFTNKSSSIGHGHNHDVCYDVFSITIDDLVRRTSQSEASDLCVEAYKNQRGCRCRTNGDAYYPDNYPDELKARWNRTTKRNIQLVSPSTQGGGSDVLSEYDVVLYGDSITEHWAGTDLGYTFFPWTGVHEAFDRTFNKRGGSGASLDGVALGIGGDRVGQVLYRLRNGELPDTLNAKVFWVLIGTNDFGGDKCNAESIAAGNIRIVQELLTRRPDATIVLNSILPRGPRGKDLWRSDDWSWAQITRINQWLECYAASTDNVTFFNATKLFVLPNTTSTIFDFYEDDVHPSAAGSVVWASEMSDFIHSIIR
jgi:lysophospholipase L1-like esterase